MVAPCEKDLNEIQEIFRKNLRQVPSVEISFDTKFNRIGTYEGFLDVLSALGVALKDSPRDYLMGSRFRYHNSIGRFFLQQNARREYRERASPEVSNRFYRYGDLNDSELYAELTVRDLISIKRHVSYLESEGMI